MKILLSGLDSGGLGGAEKFLADLAGYFRKKGNDVSFISFAKSKFTKVLKDKKFNVYETPVRMDVIGDIKGFLKFILFLIPSFWWNYKILAFAKKKGVKIVILSGFTDEIILSALVKLMNLKLIWVCFAPVGSIYNKNFGVAGFLYSLVTDLPDLIITPTEYSKRFLLEESKMDKRKMRVIACGLKPIQRKIRKRAKEKIIGMVSRIEKPKGQDVLIKAYSQVVKKIPKSKLVIIGEGQIASLKRLAKRLGIEKKVEFKGRVEDAYDEISRFDVFVFPSSWKLEGFGLVLVEAMMLGVPIIASKFGPIPEVTKDSAMLIDGNYRDFAKGIEEVLTNENLRKKLIRRVLIRAKEFSIEKVGKAYLAQIKWISQ